MVLWDLYGVRQIFGIKAGYRGFYSYEPIQLNPKMVHHLHRRGGTFLQTSRGGFHLQRIVDSIQNSGFNQVRRRTLLAHHEFITIYKTHPHPFLICSISLSFAYFVRDPSRWGLALVTRFFFLVLYIKLFLFHLPDR